MPLATRVQAHLSVGLLQNLRGHPISRKVWQHAHSPGSVAAVHGERRGFGPVPQNCIGAYDFSTRLGTGKDITSPPPMVSDTQSSTKRSSGAKPGGRNARSVQRSQKRKNMQKLARR
jgi:hypothetical protein